MFVGNVSLVQLTSQGHQHRPPSGQVLFKSDSGLSSIQISQICWDVYSPPTNQKWNATKVRLTIFTHLNSKCSAHSLRLSLQHLATTGTIIHQWWLKDLLNHSCQCLCSGCIWTSSISFCHWAAILMFFLPDSCLLFLLFVGCRGGPG